MESGAIRYEFHEPTDFICWDMAWEKRRSGARAAEEAALEMPYTVTPYRGFKSLPLRLYHARRLANSHKGRQLTPILVLFVAILEMRCRR